MANNPSANASRPPFVVRSIEVPVGAEAPFTALFLADTHLTLCDAHDNGCKNALAAARRQGEFRDAERFLREALARARERRPDLLLHAGDVIDFTSGHCGSAIRTPPQMPDFGLEGQKPEVLECGPSTGKPRPTRATQRVLRWLVDVGVRQSETVSEKSKDEQDNE